MNRYLAVLIFCAFALIMTSCAARGSADDLSAPSSAYVAVSSESETATEDNAETEESKTESDTGVTELSEEPAYSCPEEESEEEYEGISDEESEESAEQSEESAEQYESAYINVDKGVSYLSADVFSSSRIVSEVSEQFKDHYLSFAVSLLQKCANGKSAFISPLSALTALQMAANGARGETAEEMQKTLGGALSTDTLNQELFNYYESLRNTANASLKYANSIWMTDNEHFKVNKRFVDIINDTFRAALVCAPLAEDSTTDAINDWCGKNTDGMIPKLLEYGDLDPNTVMVLLNSLTFDGLWGIPFSDNKCSNGTFHGETRDTTVKMMTNEEYGYICGEHETGFVKKYEGRTYSFVAILPEEGISMEEYLASLDGEKLAALLDYNHETVVIGIPEFTFDWSASLSGALQEMGIKQAFLPTADFSGLGVMDDGENIFLEKVYQKTHIEIDQSGTRAAAVTAIAATTEGDSDPIYTVILDRPFVYAIVDTQNLLPVFIGCVTDIG